MKIPIAMPLYDRPEFLAETINSLNGCDRLEDAAVYGYLDPGSSEMDAVIAEWEKLKASKKLYTRMARVGGSENILGAIFNVCEHHPADTIILLESDHILAKGYIRFMQAKAGEFSNNEKVMGIGGRAMPGGMRKWTTSRAPLFFQKRLRWMRENAAAFFQCPNEFGLSIVAKHVNDPVAHNMLNNGRFWNPNWGGLMALCMLENDYRIFYPEKPFATHIGWYGWHWDKQKQVAAGVDCKEKFIQDPDRFDPSFDINLEYGDAADGD